MTDSYEALYRSVPAKSKYRKALSEAHGFGVLEGKTEARLRMITQLENRSKPAPRSATLRKS